MLTFVSSNIVSRCVFSHKIEEEDGCSKFGELVKRLMVLFSGFCFGDMFPYLSWADVLTGFVPSMKALSSDLDAFFDQVIKEHRALGEKDFVSIIMQLQKDGLFENLTQDNIKAILLDMFVGGTDTKKLSRMVGTRLQLSEAASTTQSTTLNDFGGTSRYTSDLDQGSG
ncbi:hypothetical protein V6N13_061980 [Hibiscus sabdariffa]